MKKLVGEEEVAFENCVFSIKRDPRCFTKCSLSMVKINDFFLLQRVFDPKSEENHLNRIKKLLQAERKDGGLFERMEDAWRRKGEEEESFAIVGFDGREPWKGVGYQKNGGLFVNMNEEELVFSTDVTQNEKKR